MSVSRSMNLTIMLQYYDYSDNGTDVDTGNVTNGTGADTGNGTDGGDSLAPSISILDPSSGDIFEPGEIITISGTSTNIPRGENISITLGDRTKLFSMPASGNWSVTMVCPDDAGHYHISVTWGEVTESTSISVSEEVEAGGSISIVLILLISLVIVIVIITFAGLWMVKRNVHSPLWEDDIVNMEEPPAETSVEQPIDEYTPEGDADRQDLEGISDTDVDDFEGMEPETQVEPIDGVDEPGYQKEDPGYRGEEYLVAEISTKDRISPK